MEKGMFAISKKDYEENAFATESINKGGWEMKNGILLYSIIRWRMESHTEVL